MKTKNKLMDWFGFFFLIFMVDSCYFASAITLRAIFFHGKTFGVTGCWIIWFVFWVLTMLSSTFFTMYLVKYVEKRGLFKNGK